MFAASRLSSFSLTSSVTSRFFSNNDRTVATMTGFRVVLDLIDYGSGRRGEGSGSATTLAQARRDAR